MGQSKKILVAKTITLPRDEYTLLVSRARAYERIQQLVQEDFFAPPPIRTAKKVITEMRKTKCYSAAFLKSVGRGLKQSSYFS